jgi:hypothetical protein
MFGVVNVRRGALQSSYGVEVAVRRGVVLVVVVVVGRVLLLGVVSSAGRDVPGHQWDAKNGAPVKYTYRLSLLPVCVHIANALTKCLHGKNCHACSLLLICLLQRTVIFLYLDTYLVRFHLFVGPDCFFQGVKDPNVMAAM